MKLTNVKAKFEGDVNGHDCTVEITMREAQFGYEPEHDVISSMYGDFMTPTNPAYNVRMYLGDADKFTVKTKAKTIAQGIKVKMGVLTVANINNARIQYNIPPDAELKYADGVAEFKWEIKDDQ